MGRGARSSGWAKWLAAGAALLLALPAAAADTRDAAGGGAAADVSVQLSGGSLKGGRAHVQARVMNGSGRALLGVRIAAYYDTLDALPAADAVWRLHEFLLEPPLAPGGAAQLEFDEDNAAEFVLLRVAYARLALAIGVEGRALLPAQAELLERDGAQYVAARDLAAALGAKLTQAADKRITLALPDSGPALAYRAGDAQAALDGRAATFAHAPLEQDGRSWLPLHATCALLGYEADYDLAENTVRLSRTT